VGDVAERAGVGVMTVSRALEAPHSVSEPLRARVEAAVEALGYVPDRFAGGLASAGTRLVTVIVPSLSRRVFSDIVHGADAVLRPRGFQILFSNTFYSLGQEEETCRAVLGWRPEGVIIAGVDHTAGTRRLLAEAGVPVVEAMELGDDPIDLNVGLSHLDAGRRMGEHLVARGYRRIGFVGTQLDADFRAARRRAGFLQALAGHGLACAAEDSGGAPASFRIDAEAMARLLERRAPVDALFCVNDELAVGAILDPRVPAPWRAGARRGRDCGLQRPRDRRRAGALADHRDLAAPPHRRARGARHPRSHRRAPARVAAHRRRLRDRGARERVMRPRETLACGMERALAHPAAGRTRAAVPGRAR